MMNILSAVRLYLSGMVDQAGAGMKVLLMDRDTISFVSVAFAQSDMHSKEVYLFERINKQRSDEVMKYLKCIVFVRPTEANVKLLIQELRAPRYGEYYLHFSNSIPRTDIKKIADADDFEVVKEVQECYGDLIPLAPHLFSLNLERCLEGMCWYPPALKRCADGLIGSFLSLRKCPVIRYQASSDIAKRLADVVNQEMMRESKLFEVPRSDISPLLIIVDRRIDLVSTMLNQWTYQAMVHELLGIKNNRVNLSHLENVAKELHDVVLSAEQDDFYMKNQYLNFGEIGTNIKLLVEEYQQKSELRKGNLESIQDIKQFVENYPQFRKIQGMVAKHVAIVGELSRLVGAHSLLEVSEVEQEMASQGDHQFIYERIRQLVGSTRVRDIDALRLVCLYAVTFDKQPRSDLPSLLRMLEHRGIDREQQEVVQMLLDQHRRCSTASLGTNEFTTENVRAFTRKMIKGLKGVENIYTQHSPMIKELLTDVIRGRLRDAAYPVVGGGPSTVARHQDIILFIVGGVTYEESLVSCQIMQQFPGVRVLLGGSNIHNFSSFINELKLSQRKKSNNPFDSSIGESNWNRR
ncbi:vacuolar protein sorting-associated protein 45-like isoform X1 [Varroa destructor]|uniref:Vacuolar protein sorting-associated protein 45 n=3 Tax=Varroa destructor TaxID=109461 RepID=A0A7M7J0J5_VARDE|nr:vacuolar protein sorting-associated protein 45-like isoform X1 [Varroa destructor]